MELDSDLGMLSSMDYPGRYLLIQTEPGRDIVVYGITGRSPSSQARKFVQAGNKILVRPSDEDELKKGNPDLLIYTAIAWDENLIVASNGKQTDAKERDGKPVSNLFDTMTSSISPDPNEPFERSMKDWEYEPDKPHYTPRIFGTATKEGCCLGTIYRNDNGIAIKRSYLVEGGRGISTYQGLNLSPLPSYTDSPFPLHLQGDADSIAEDVWNGITRDFRVSVGVVIKYRIEKEAQTSIVNKNP